jgi:superfamily I DNA/RNA helicase
MSLRIVTGGAGTGKTTRLLALLDEWLTSHPLQERQRVLALTFMHGSRLRLTERLRASRARNAFDCITIDSFARQLCARWRSRLAALGVVLPPEESDSVYDATCEAAARLLDESAVVRWVAATHPIIVVDEFQDCRGARPHFVERLAHGADVLVAADPFQDLKQTGANPAMEMIERSGVSPEELTTVHRTRVPALLAAATALRAGRPVVQGAGFQIVVAPRPPLAAYEVCRIVATSKQVSPVVISAGRPSAGTFAAKVVEAVETTKGYGKSKNLGPYAIPWESSPDSYREQLLEALDVGDASHSPESVASALDGSNPLSRGMHEWLDRERRLRGRAVFTNAEVRAQVRRAEAAFRALPRYGGGRRALTIHQAKNREFRRVIVLWGFTLPKDPEVQRRWLYNAITRAMDAAWIIVHGSASRLNAPPFA